MSTPRQRAHEQTLLDLKRLALGQLAEAGSSGLSLRALARELGLVSSAVYRYVPSRDELLTLLIVDAYNALGADVEAAEGRSPRRDLRARWLAAGRAIRRWGVAHPAEWALLYGSQVPGYAAPAERTVGPGTRVSRLLLRLVGDLDRSAPALPPGPPIPRPLRRDLARLRAAEVGVDAVSESRLVAGLLAWTAVFGLVSFEVFGQYRNGIERPATFFDYQLERLGTLIGLPAEG